MLGQPTSSVVETAYSVGEETDVGFWRLSGYCGSLVFYGEDGGKNDGE